MITEITITVLPEEEKNPRTIESHCFAELRKAGIDADQKETSFVCLKKSIDARHGKLRLHLRYKAYIGEKPGSTAEHLLPVWKKADGTKSVVIVGAGPAGLFGALELLEHGIQPVIIERGEETAERKRTIAKISTAGVVNPDSNYCFGEGGAGTFSDGKLYTRSNKRGNIARILQIFVHFGANPAVLTDAHPHIGTEKLPAVINAMKQFIVSMGGEFHFHTKCTGFILEDMRVRGITAQNVITGECSQFPADAVVLAAGHSASDIYTMISDICPAALEAKSFAVGVRAEHPRSVIDAIQYHGKTDGMGAAEYRLTAQINGRGVYSFCMCPGGFVVPAQTEEDAIVVNGMSASGRNSSWSNAAIVVETRPEDIPGEFKEQAEKAGCPPLAGLFFRQHIERMTKRAGDGQKAPAQMMKDFIAGKDSSALAPTSYTPGTVPSRLDRWLPKQIAGRLSEGFCAFNRQMNGFVSSEAVLIASETRTSTPVRILRDRMTFESPFLKGLFPAGEGSGYAGGIVSSAMDGENVCRSISKAQAE